MSNPENRCPECGAALAEDRPQGLCPRCLLKRGLETNTMAGDGGSTPSKADYVPPSPAELASYFPDLEILELVGRGGMGVVYKARQKRLGRLVALKILAPRIGRDPAFAERFAREARAMAMLSHQHIVTVHDFGQTSLPPSTSGREAEGEGVPEPNPQSPIPSPSPNPSSNPSSPLYYFLMEYVDGLTLRQLLDTGKLWPEEAVAIVPQICDALQYAHDRGIVHRDIKPENILIDRAGQVKIADFGLAKLVGGDARDLTLTDVGQVMGTPYYMAPEQTERPKEVDHRADIYSLGVVFYQMLTGELPIGRFAPPSQKVQIDVRLDEVVLRALEKEPTRRFQHVSDLKTEVESITATPPVSPKSAEPPPKAAEREDDYTLSRFSGMHLFLIAWTVFAAFYWLFVGMSRVSTFPYPLFLSIPSILAPFAVPLLGWKTVQDIRRSGGKLKGLGLAFFHGIFFPLIAVDALMVFNIYSLLCGNAFSYDAAFIAIVLAGIFDWWIISRLWQRVKLFTGISPSVTFFDRYFLKPLHNFFHIDAPSIVLRSGEKKIAWGNLSLLFLPIFSLCFSIICFQAFYFFYVSMVGWQGTGILAGAALLLTFLTLLGYVYYDYHKPTEELLFLETPQPPCRRKRLRHALLLSFLFLLPTGIIFSKQYAAIRETEEIKQEIRQILDENGFHEADPIVQFNAACDSGWVGFHTCTLLDDENDKDQKLPNNVRIYLLKKIEPGVWRLWMEDKSLDITLRLHFAHNVFLPKLLLYQSVSPTEKRSAVRGNIMRSSRLVVLLNQEPAFTYEIPKTGVFSLFMKKLQTNSLLAKGNQNIDVLDCSLINQKGENCSMTSNLDVVRKYPISGDLNFNHGLFTPSLKDNSYNLGKFRSEKNKYVFVTLRIEKAVQENISPVSSSSTTSRTQENTSSASFATSQTLGAKAPPTAIAYSAPKNFKASLPNGVEVELLGVCENPSEGKQWWRPDGSPLDQRPYDRQEGNPFIANAQQRREIAIKIHPLSTDHADLHWKLDPPIACSMGSSTTAGEYRKEIQSLIVGAEKPLKKLSIRLGAAIGEWKTVVQSNASSSLHGLTSDSTFAFSSPEMTEKGLVITATHSLSTDDSSFRLVAIDTQGNVVTPAKTNYNGGKKFQQITATFPRLNLADVKTFELQTRPYEWVDFKDVALYPNQNPPGDKTLSPPETAKEQKTDSVSTENAIHFSPLQERLITAQDFPQGIVFFSLAQGKTFPSPFPLKTQEQLPKFIEYSPELKKWIRDNDIDLVFWLQEKRWWITEIEMRSGGLGQLTEWASVSPQKVFEIIQKARESNTNLIFTPNSSSGGYAQYIEGEAFCTRQNRYGVLKIRGVDGIANEKYENVNGLLLQYHFLEVQPQNSLDSSKEKLNAFKTFLPNFVEVELLGVAENPSEANAWWRPDGTPLSERPYERPEKRRNSLPDTDEGMVVREFAVQVHNVESDDVDTCFQIDQSGLNVAIIVPEENNTRIRNRFAVAADFSKDQHAATMRFGIASGPWKTLCEESPGGSSASANGKDGFIVSTIDEEKEDSFSISFTHNISENNSSNLRFVVLDKDGREHLGKIEEKLSALDQFVQYHVRFSDVQLKDARTLLFQTRPYEWVEFKEVALYPDQNTPGDKTLSTPEAEKEQKSDSISPNDAHFGPKETRFLSNNEFKSGVVFMNLSLGKSFPPPMPVEADNILPGFMNYTPELKKWILDNGIDFVFLISEKEWRMAAIQIRCREMQPPLKWETLQPRHVFDLLNKPPKSDIDFSFIPTAAAGNYSRNPQFFAFGTHKQRNGVIKMTGVPNVPTLKDEKVNGLLLEYKFIEEKPENTKEPKANSETIDKPPHFGPVIERTLKLDSTFAKNCFIDFDRGEVLSLPTDVLEEMVKRGAAGDLESLKILPEWMQKNGVDAMTGVIAHPVATSDAEHVTALAATVLQSTLLGERVDNAEWDLITPDILEGRLTTLAKKEISSKETELTIQSLHQYPATYIFQTREGGKGILQLLDPATVDNDGIPIRFKMLEKGPTAVPASPQEKPNEKKSATHFGPVIEQSVEIHSNDFQNCFLDLDTDKVLSLPAYLLEKLPKDAPNRFEEASKIIPEWMEKNGIDIAALDGIHFPLIEPSPDEFQVGSIKWYDESDNNFDSQLSILLDNPLKGIMFGEEVSVIAWNNMTPDQLEARLENLVARYPKTDQAGVRLSARGKVHLTYIFQTRQGGKGILQTLVPSISSDPNGNHISLRFKMLQKEPIPTPSKEIKQEAGSPDS